MKCLLVILEKFENSVFHLFHDTLIGAHYGPMNTYYTTCLKNYKGIYPLVKHVNNRSRKEVRFLIFTQGFLLVTTQ